jgi:hypothetical protein
MSELVYKCCMCDDGVTHTGTPAWKNAAGYYCPKHREIVKQRIADGMRKRVSLRDGVCIWCGEPIIEARNHGNNHTVNIHVECEKNRDWFLKCVRYSDVAAKYAARIEAREAPARKARKMLEDDIIVVKSIPLSLHQPVVKSERDERMENIEKMLKSLMDQLGA